MKSLSVVVWISAVLALPAFGSVGPSIEVPVAPPTIARAAGTQQAPHVATDGHDFFAVWLDSRGMNTSVFGTRILADGTVLDPTGILIASPGVECSTPVLVWDGSNYVVVWTEEHDVPYFSTRAGFARVDHNGTVLGGPKTLLDHVSGAPLIASNGHGSVVIFTSYAGYIAHISQDGSVTPKQSITGLGGDRQIASNGDGYLLSWTGPTTSLLRLDDNGDLVAGSDQRLNEAIYTESAAGIGGPYLLVGRKSGSAGSSCAQSIVGRLVTNTGLSDPFVIYDAGGEDIQDFAVTPDGNGFQVVWMKRLGDYPCGPTLEPDPPTFFGPWPSFGLAQIHIGQDGSSGMPSTAEPNGSDEQPAVAGNGAAEVLVWIESNDTSSTQIAAAITHPGVPVAPIPIASSAAMEVYSSVAAADSMFMTAWVEGDPFEGTSAVYARRFGTDGHAIDAAAIKVSADNQTRNFFPAVSFDGAVWLFVWSTSPHASARRMAADGTWIDAAPFPIGPTDRVFDYAVASNGDGFAVFILGAGPALSLTFIPRTGDTRQVPLAVPGLKSYLVSPSMAWDGSAYVAVWRQGTDDDIEGIRLDQDGQVITPLFGIDRSSRLDDTPSIACHEGACAVAWRSNDSIAAASIIGGTVIPYKMIDPSSSTTYLTAPKVVATQNGFQLFWNEEGDPTPSLLTASITQAGIDSPTLLGTAGVTGAAITPHGQTALSLVHADGGVARAFLRIWLPSDVRRRAVGR